MKAIVIKRTGHHDVLELEDIPKPKPAKGQALVKLHAAGINFIDIYMRTGRYARDLPFTPGLEGSGIVEEVGEGVTSVKPGDRVAYADWIGSYAEYNVVPEERLIPLPDDFSYQIGAAFPLQGMTAHYLVHDYYRITPGSKVLVHAAAGGVGLLVVQWLKHLGATVFGTVSSEEKAEFAREAGADHLIFYRHVDFVEEIMRLTNFEGVDYIIDGVGKSTFTHDLDAVRIRGQICLFGSASGPADPLAPNSLQKKSITVSGGSLFDFIKKREELLERAKAVLNAIKEKWLVLKIDHEFPLEQASEAQRMLETRQTSGKVILKID